MYQPHDWKDTHTLRGEEIKLAKLLKDNSGQNRQSLEQEAFEAEQPGEDEEIEETDVGRNNSILPGTFIETRRSEDEHNCHLQYLIRNTGVLF